MREIDPIRNPSEALLSAALHRLAKGSAQSAPADVGTRLAQEFRRHHARRRRIRSALVVSLVASLVLAAVLLLSSKPVRQNAPAVAREPAPAVAPPSAARATQNVPAPEQASQTGRKTVQTASSRVQSSFMPLEAYDPATVPSELQIVRLELTGADLRLVGAPVAEELSEKRLLADIVVGSDGTPYAVRLVR